MPAYDYRCEPCDTVFEIVRSVSDRTDVACPECGETAKRVFTPVGVVFKGSGFHNTDYRPKRDEAPKAKPEAACEKSGSSPACGSCPAKQD